ASAGLSCDVSAASVPCIRAGIGHAPGVAYRPAHGLVNPTSETRLFHSAALIWFAGFRQATVASRTGSVEINDAAPGGLPAGAASSSFPPPPTARSRPVAPSPSEKGPDGLGSAPVPRLQPSIRPAASLLTIRLDPTGTTLTT